MDRYGLSRNRSAFFRHTNTNAGERSHAMFHYLYPILIITGIAAAVRLAWLFRSPASRHQFHTILLICSLLLAAGELYKQLLNYFVINDRSYDWWLTPFQLCSLPMYLCPLLPCLRRENHHRIICTFLLDFNMMGAIATFIDPSGLFHDNWTLTLHGILWHLMLIFIGMFVLFSRQADLSSAGFLNTLPLFAVFCCLAEIFNLLLASRGTINLFFISPYVNSTQIFFSDIDRLLGRPVGIVLYLLAMLAGAWLIHRTCRLLDARFHPL